MQPAMQRASYARATYVAAAGRFGGFAKESGQDVRQADIRKDEKLESMLKAWEQLSRECDEGGREKRRKGGSDYLDSQEIYAISLRLLKGMEYSSRDVETFCMELERFQELRLFGWKAGLFLSALINNSPDKRFQICTTHMEKKLAFLGRQSGKEVIVCGDVGGYAGIYMIGGSLVVKGSAQNCPGAGMISGEIIIEGDAGAQAGLQMEGGLLTISGKAENSVGQAMKGGQITVKGLADFDVGFNMYGGVIRLEQGCTKLARHGYGGQVYDMGKLVWQGGTI